MRNLLTALIAFVKAAWGRTWVRATLAWGQFFVAVYFFGAEAMVRSLLICTAAFVGTLLVIHLALRLRYRRA